MYADPASVCRARSWCRRRLCYGAYPPSATTRRAGPLRDTSGAACYTAAMSDPLLSIRDLRTYFRASGRVARAVDGVSFDVGAHETVGLVGESGCGKSVTSLSILRLIDPPGQIEPGSRIEFEGRDLLALQPAAMRDIRGNRISMIFQEPMTSLNPVFTVGDQIAEVARVHSTVSRREAWERAVEMLRVTGIADPAERAKEYPHQLSGGMRQRVMIAMALMMNPALLIADEPTTALDVTIQAQILELLAGLQERTGMSVLLITHDLGVIAESDRKSTRLNSSHPSISY